MLRINPKTLDYEWIPPGLCFAEEEAESEGGGEEKTEETTEVTEEKTETSDDWRTGIEDEKHLEFAKRFNTPAEMAKAGFEFRQKVSQSAIVPGDDASDEDKNAFRKAVGVPESAEGYEVALPEGYEATEQDKAFHGSIQKAAFEGGISPGQFKLLNAAFNEHTANVAAEMEKATEAAVKGKLDGLKDEWGKEFDTNAKIAQDGFEKFAEKEDIAFAQETMVDGVPLGDHPAFLKAWSRVGRATAGDAINGHLISDEQRGDLKTQFNQLMSQQQDAMGTGNTVERDRLQREMDKINAKLGSGPIVGAEGRAA